MLYQIHELSRKCIEPVAQLANLSAQLLTDPFLPLSYLPFARDIAAGCELTYRLGKTYARPAFNIGTVDVAGRRVGVTEETVRERPFCKLLHFRKGPDVPAQPTVLLVAPLAGHHATLVRDTVGALLTDHDVYLTDWADARGVPVSAGPFSLQDYVACLLEFMRLLGPDLHIVAICQSTVPVLAAVALMASARDPRLPRSMTMIGGPIDTRLSPTRVNRLATDKPLSWFRDVMIQRVPYGYPGAGRAVYPGFVQQACFASMHLGRHVDSYRDFYARRCRGEPAQRHCAFYDDYNATADMPAEFYLETIEAVFQECWLARGMWRVAGQAVRPQDIRSVALFTIEGDRDDITGPGQTAAAHDLCPGIPAAKRRAYVASDAGHYCIFSGRRWRQTIYPRLRSFIRENDGVRSAAGTRDCSARSVSYP